ncbi:MAG: hypothetical protein UY26_C0001G0015 [Candidatus Jorgensenbacteria bacterium GW2011_GWA1_48_13]|uniref:Uncharacterized protein n=2 Tax=Candidatus Joergenseniibacteriota TaxID=1752739 RepID=A0A0G1W8Z5_9BACT|nr:MAG: hypothetical protein UY26_C0001G0015 [Candidatus Jorgensenbacteria bacterium GW2011_GWA1_48_13]KKU99376.1 MAG: hypothetical protein UY32_C0001G0011 [Candidatus Jorgensenbacteria bacterium GW2011_GWC1_48_8]KKW15261.1 MAG: hypothetical protein UY55_C0001G0015 [Candidatus Jorgensenbacteria bacterium GW2011_GWB1_50_10]
MKKFLFSIFYFLLSGATVFAQGFIWEGTGEGGDKTCNVVGPCDFCDALIATQNIIQFLFQIAIPITVAMIAYGAIRMMISAASEEQVRNARHIMTSAVVGLVIALSAWVIVNTVLHVLAKDATVEVWNEITCNR